MTLYELVDQKYDQQIAESFEGIPIIKTNKVIHKNILLLGLTGSGKSRFLNLIMNLSENSRMAPNPVSTKIEYYQGVRIGEMILNILDTVGLGDPLMDVDEITRETMIKIHQTMPRISNVIVFLKMDRLRSKITSDVNQILDDLVSFGLKIDNTMLIITFADMFNVKVHGSFYEELLKTNIHPMLKKCNYRFVSLCDPLELKPGFVNLMSQITRDDMKWIIEKIYNTENYITIESEIQKAHIRTKSRLNSFRKWMCKSFCCCLE